MQQYHNYSVMHLSLGQSTVFCFMFFFCSVLKCKMFHVVLNFTKYYQLGYLHFQIIKDLGGIHVENDINRCTHLVTDKVNSRLAFL